MKNTLKNKTVVLTRDRHGNRTWAKHLTKLGANVYQLPTIQVQALPPTAVMKPILEDLADFDWIVFTSAAGVRHFYTLVTRENGRWLPPKGRVAVIGSTTARAVEATGAQVDFQPSHPSSEKLGSELTPVRGMHILLPRSAIASHTLEDMLQARGGVVTPLPLYETRSIHTTDKDFGDLLLSNKVDILIFASPSAVRGFDSRLGNSKASGRARTLTTIAVGPKVAESLERAHFSHIYTSATPTINSVVDLLQHVSSTNLEQPIAANDL